jgi:hypothetical protein
VVIVLTEAITARAGVGKVTADFRIGITRVIGPARDSIIVLSGRFYTGTGLAEKSSVRYKIWEWAARHTYKKMRDCHGTKSVGGGRSRVTTTHYSLCSTLSAMTEVHSVQPVHFSRTKRHFLFLHTPLLESLRVLRVFKH